MFLVKWMKRILLERVCHKMCSFYCIIQITLMDHYEINCHLKYIYVKLPENLARIRPSYAYCEHTLLEGSSCAQEQVGLCCGAERTSFDHYRVYLLKLARLLTWCNIVLHCVQTFFKCILNRSYIWDISEALIENFRKMCPQVRRTQIGGLRQRKCIRRDFFLLVT